MSLTGLVKLEGVIVLSATSIQKHHVDTWLQIIKVYKSNFSLNISLGYTQWVFPSLAVHEKPYTSITRISWEFSVPTSILYKGRQQYLTLNCMVWNPTALIPIDNSKATTANWCCNLKQCLIFKFWKPFSLMFCS